MIRRDIMQLFYEGRMYGNKTLIDTPLFALLEKAVYEPHSATAGLTAAYDGFVTILESLCESGVSHSHLKRTLCYTQQELLALRNDIAAGETRKEIASVCTKALGMIRCEEEILKHCVEHPERLQSLPIRSCAQQVSSGSLRWRGSMLGLMELICALYYSGYVTDASGIRPSFASFVGAFSHLLNFPIDRPYDMRARLAGRKKRLSVLLPALKNAFEQNIVRCGITPR